MEDENLKAHINVGGPYGLWLSVFSMSFYELLKDKDHQAELFLFDETNQFFDAVCDGLFVEPDAMRQRLKLVLKAGKPESIRPQVGVITSPTFPDHKPPRLDSPRHSFYDG
jgi:hypothetical protein